MRLGGFEELAHLCRVGNEHVVGVCREALQRLTDDDSRTVSLAARGELARLTVAGHAPHELAVLPEPADAPRPATPAGLPAEEPAGPQRPAVAPEAPAEPVLLSE